MNVIPDNHRFYLPVKFINEYKYKDPKFGFGNLGKIIYYRTYSRIKPGTDEKEEWFETVARVVEGTYTMQKDHVLSHNLGWSERKALRSARRMYDKIFNMKFTPPGRGLWAMGTDIINKHRIYAALNNCGFTSTADITKDKSKPFKFLMDMTMLGIGVGFDTKGAGAITIQKNLIQRAELSPEKRATLLACVEFLDSEIKLLMATQESRSEFEKQSALDTRLKLEYSACEIQNFIDCGIDVDIFSVPDTREGWVDATDICIAQYLNEGSKPVVFDYRDVRPQGVPLKTFGGVASGPLPLIMLHIHISDLMGKATGTQITTTMIADIMNLIGCAVIAGNVRRSSEICLSPLSDEALNLKNFDKNPQRAAHGWASNNSILANIGDTYSGISDYISANGEPGLFWLGNVHNYARMQTPDRRDHRAAGTNPCSEQSLEPYELCCLVENYLNRHSNIEEFLDTLKFSYMYAKTVTLGNSHWPETNRVQMRNRRIGCSLTGIAQFLETHTLDELREWCERGYEVIQHYDCVYSEWFTIPRSIRTTSIKPSGTVSLLAGATPGIHYPISDNYIRRVRFMANDKLVDLLRDAGHKVEPCAMSPLSTVVVEFPVSIGKNIRASHKVSMWEKLALAAFVQRYWSDNQVSCTITFDRETEGPQIEAALNYYQYQLKSVSFLAETAPGKQQPYPQMPYEAITYDDYVVIAEKITQIRVDNVDAEDVAQEYGCDSEFCVRKGG